MNFGFFQIARAEILDMDSTTSRTQLEKLVLVDASMLASCKSSSVIKAKCLPADTFQSKKDTLASFYDITWAFGTAGLNGSEELLIFADTENQRDALLGILYLAGHNKLWRWNAKKLKLQKLLGKSAGQTRGIIRSKIYTANMRDDRLVLPQELIALTKRGWKLSEIDTKNQISKQIIISKKPLDAIARFIRLQINKKEEQTLKVMIDPLPISLSTSTSTS